MSTNGKKDNSVPIAKMVESVGEFLPSQEMLSLGVQLIRNAGFPVSYLKMLGRISLIRIEEVEAMTVLEPFVLPTWNRIKAQGDHYERKELTKIGLFVYDQEPSGKPSTKWREGLTEAITEAYQLGYLEAIEVLKRGNKI